MTSSLPSAVSVLLAGVLLLGTPGCYLARSAWEQAGILAGRRPIAELIGDPRVDDGTRHKLQLVLDARDFARDSLRLRTDAAFTTFSDVGRDTLLLVLSAAHRDRLVAHTWWFPIVGRLPYKGFFNFAAARREAAQLHRDGLDVYLRPADAFSTLGWFDDPLLSTSLVRDSTTLVETVIHELTHTTFYAPGSAPFNESFANFVGNRGAAEFFRTRGQPVAARLAELAWADQKLLGSFWTELAGRLDSAFARHPDSREVRLLVRDSVYAEARRQLVEEIAPRLQSVPPVYAVRVPLDNASLLARLVYSRELELFDAVWEVEEQDLRAAIDTIIRLARSRPEDPFGAVRDWVGGAVAR